MFETGGRVGVAVSGGADSVVLLRLLHDLAERLGIELFVLHVNHGLRAAESDEDERFVESLAASLHLPFVTSGQLPPERNIETAARRQRQEFFRTCRTRYALNRIALGHTRSDQAETVLHRFLRGSGTAGLAAMRFVTPDGYVRPLLAATRSEVREWALAQGWAWREDSSNGDLSFTRNRLRHRTLPDLSRDFNSNLESVLASTAELARAEEDYWTEEIEGVFAEITKRTHWGLVFEVEQITKYPVAVRRRVLRRALQGVRPEGLRGLDFDHCEQILRLCESSDGHDRVLVPGADALRSFNSLLLAREGALAQGRHYRLDLQTGYCCDLPNGAGQICIEQVTPEALGCDTFKEVQEAAVERVRLDRGAVTGKPLQVRNWQPGDALHRPGHGAPEKIKALFQQQRIRLWERRHWPVVVSGEDIVWARGFGVANRFQPQVQGVGMLQLVYRAESGAQGP
jgi:tRNA(Ile)-lysidine synthase